MTDYQIIMAVIILGMIGMIISTVCDAIGKLTTRADREPQRERKHEPPSPA